MSIETLESRRWHLDISRDAIEAGRTRRINALAPGESISFVDTPAPVTAFRQAQSAGLSANDSALQDTQSQPGSEASSGADPGSANGLLNLSASHSHAGALALLPPPTASAEELAIIDLALANPLNVALIAAFAPETPALNGGNTQMLIERYGRERAQTMLQLGLATNVVRERYADAVDQALDSPSDAQSWWHSSIEEVHASPGERQHGVQEPERQWQFDVAEFTRRYCEQSGLEYEAFAQLYGNSVECVSTQYSTNPANDRAHSSENHLVANGQFELSITRNGFEGDSRQNWHHGTGQLFRGLVAFDPNDPPRLLDDKAVSFDATLGFVTPSDNIDRSSGTEMAMVLIAGVVISVMTAGAASAAAASVTSSTGSAALGAAAGGAVSGLAVSMVTGMITGDLSFKSLLVGTLTSAITAGITKGAGFDTAGLDSAGNVVDYGARALAITGKATLQGALTDLAGGKFIDGFTNGIASGLGSEIARGLNLEILSALKSDQITEFQASALRNLAQATGSAISALANPENAGYAIAREFLNTVLSSLGGTSPSNDSGSSRTDTQDDAIELDVNGRADTSDRAGAGTDETSTGPEVRDTNSTDEAVHHRDGSGDSSRGAEGNTSGPDGSANVEPHEGAQQVVVTGSRTAGGNNQGGGSSIYAGPYVNVYGVAGAMPVGGHENLALARDLPMLSTDFTPNFVDGRTGVGVPYRDQAGNVFYRTFDATGAYAGWVSSPVVVAALPLAAAARVAAPVAEAVIAAELTYGTPQFKALAGLTLAGTAWWVLNQNSDPLFRDALTPEEVREFQRPTEHVPVSPGPAGTPGQVADSRDTSTPGYQAPDSQSTATTVLPTTEPSWADQITTRNPDDSPPKPDFVPSRTVATGTLGGSPEGYVSPNPNGDRGIARENEAANSAAAYGYTVIQNPTLTPELRALNGISETADPDLLIEGKVFDVKSPLDAASAEAAIERSVEKLQSHRFLINASDFVDPESSVRDLAARLRERPPEGLQEVKVLVNGVIRNIFP